MGEHPLVSSQGADAVRTLQLSGSVRIEMTLLPKAPVRVHRHLRLPQRLAPVPPLQAGDHQRLGPGVEFGGKQRR